MIYTNIPWTQVVLAGCAFITLIIVLIKLIWNFAAFQKELRKDVDLIMSNHLPHILQKLEDIETWLYSQDRETKNQKPN